MVSKHPNHISYYPGEKVKLTCVVKNITEEESIQYRWRFTSEMNETIDTTYYGSEVSLVPHFSQAGNYTCFANTSNMFTEESLGATITMNVSCKYIFYTLFSNHE